MLNCASLSDVVLEGSVCTCLDRVRLIAFGNATDFQSTPLGFLFRIHIGRNVLK